MGPYGESKEGVVVVEVRKRLRMEFPPLDMMYHVRKRRIRSAKVATAVIESAKIVTGDAMTEVDDESRIGGGKSVHRELVVVVLSVGKVVEMYVPRESNLLFKVSPSYEELLPLVTSLGLLPTFLHHHPYSVALKSLLDPPFHSVTHSFDCLATPHGTLFPPIGLLRG